MSHFKPNRKKGTVPVAVTSSNQIVALPAGGGLTVQLVNVGSNPAFYECGQDGGLGTLIATAPNTSGPVLGSTPLIPNVPVYHRLHSDDDSVALVCSSAQTATVYVTRGEFK